ncbi:DUF3278 domain-containing protein [Halalkalibacterium halodurans]|uniref:BH0365 protein n=1 Tax=Halalkalibacterium halodurans (strain ATCC BAA-125 / DSM 18197 / FERM 7344 / JCM 9153 / C-125) TaxID=272558 RepID=Q9KFV6_HALH5|nr:hypothetical protein [Halalkalibacterium halodurans]MED4125143.1 DUF3278 domain-containing protein [Halalkalibacterium halodurans]MED4172827.1 DUF3278 domain-containing protein [Halalkalibacterium halodurans]BAB04084.1 BH0365 [Halalkalibacterium halodurans C-125]
MKSWISVLLPKDEYKKQKYLYFISEGALITLIFLFLLFIGSRYLRVNVQIETALLLPIAVFTFYVMTRVILAGIEHADIATEKAYKKERRLIFVRLASFVMIFLPLYVLFVGMPEGGEWFDILGVVTVVVAGWWLCSYVSLKRSYRKNKELA